MWLTIRYKWDSLGLMSLRESLASGLPFEPDLPEDPVVKEKLYQLLEEGDFFTENRLSRTRRMLDDLVRGVSPAFTERSEEGR
jgi:hypothetical protein